MNGRRLQILIPALILAFLTDGLGLPGVGVVEVGQLSVRRVGGTGSFWGTLFVVRDDGSLSASLGATP